MEKKEKVIKQKVQKIQVKEKDGVSKTIGSYDPNTKIFKCKRNKSEHFFIKWNAWGIDVKAVEFLVAQGAEIYLKESESQWEYKCHATDFSMYGMIEEFNQHRPQYFLPLKYWDLVKVKNRSMVAECGDSTCSFNFGGNCLKGAVKIGKEGECTSYEESAG